MLNFKKGSIFSRSAGNEDDYEEYKQEDQGGVLAVWGSPGSGKTTVAAGYVYFVFHYTAPGQCHDCF